MFKGMVRAPDSSHSAALHEMVSELSDTKEAIRKRWDQLESEEIFHYTTGDAALAILNELILWSSDVLTMNDGSEFKHSVSIVDSVLMSRWSTLPVHVAEYFRPKKLLRIGSTWNMFAACFCSQWDLLSQWRAYASNCQGVAVGFRVEPLLEFGGSSNEFGVMPIHYSDDELRYATEHTCDVARRLAASSALPYNETEVFWSEVALVLLGFAIRFKNPSFAEEKECRALTLHADDSSVFSRGSRNNERRYIHLHFKAHMVSQIVIGPLAPRDLESHFRDFLNCDTFRHVAISRSAIPLRSSS
jgi:Protein of unknown function (DUF2971)